MGTTKTAITTDDGVRVAWCLLIEGYDKVLTTWGDTAAVNTAYAATEWSSSLSGLQIPGELTEKIDIFSAKLDSPSMRFVVTPDDADTFGLAVFATASTSGVEGFLDADIDSNDTTIDIDDSSDWSSGAAYIGTERVSYTGASSAQLTGVTRGMYAPFKSNTETEQRFGRPHKLANVEDTTHRPRVTSFPRTWVGKFVRLVAHRVVGTTLDVFSAGETVFAGTIEDISDSEMGNTVLECVHINRYISDSILLDDQLRGKVKEGAYWSAGSLGVPAHKFTVTEQVTDGGSIAAPSTVELTCVSGAPADHTEIQEGYYTHSDMLSIINEFLAEEKDAGNLTSTITFSLEADNRTKWLVEYTLTQASDNVYCVMTLPVNANTFMGGFPGADSDGSFEYPSSEGGAYSRSKAKRLQTFQNATGDVNGIGRLELQSTTGTWMEADDEFIPQGFTHNASADIGFLAIGTDTIVAAVHTSDTQFDEIKNVEEFGLELFGVALADPTNPLLQQTTIDIDMDGEIEVRQIQIIQASLPEMLIRMFASTGTAAYNHATWDTFDSQLSLGIPWELLGTAFEESIESLAQISPAAQMTVMLDKPTKFIEVLGPEMVLRNAYLVLDDGKLRFRMPTTPGSSPTHSLTTSGKAGQMGAGDPNRTSSRRTSRLKKNKITVEFNRSLAGKYRDHISIANLASITDSGGGGKPITIKARNTTGAKAGGGASIEGLISHLASFALGMFSHELTEVRRTINRKHFDIKPGDTVALTDDHVRDPTDGTRGVTAYPGWVESVSRDWHTGIGQVCLLLTTMDDSTRYGIYSPSALVTAYNTGTGVATVAENEFSLSSEDDDVTHFAVGDKVRFIELSPDDTSSPETWVDEIDSISGNNITTVSNTGSAIFDADHTYILTSDDRSTAASTQKTDAYIADADDNQVLGAANAYFWTSESPNLDSVSTLNTQVTDLDGPGSTQFWKIDDGDHSAGLDGGENFGMGGWFYFNSMWDSGSDNYLISKWANFQEGWLFSYDHDTGELRLSLASGTGCDVDVWLETCNWYHLAVTYISDGSGTGTGTGYFYVNGDFVGSEAIAADSPGSSTASVKIGRIGNSSAYLHADVANVFFFTRSILAPEMKRIYKNRLTGTETDLEALWQFDGDGLDSTSNGNDLEAQDSVGFKTATPYAITEGQHRWPSDVMDDEGEPVSVLAHTNAAYTLNNLVSYKTAPQWPTRFGGLETNYGEYRYTSASSTVWRAMIMQPINIGPGAQQWGDWVRRVYCYPLFYRATGSGSVSCRITFSARRPSGDSFDDVTFPAEIEQLQWDSSATSPVRKCPDSVIPPFDAATGTCWVTVELKAVNTEVAALLGIPRMNWGPMERR